MEYRQLGGSGFRVPVLSLGTGTFGGSNEFFKAWGASGVPEATRLVDVCLDAGLTMFDAHGSALAAMLLGGGFVAQFSEARVCAECGGPLERNEYGDAVCRNPDCFLGQPRRNIGVRARHRDGAER